MTMLDSLRQDLRPGVRTLRQAPGFVLLTALTLDLAVGATTFVYTYIDAVENWWEYNARFIEWTS